MLFVNAAFRRLLTKLNPCLTFAHDQRRHCQFASEPPRYAANPPGCRDLGVARLLDWGWLHPQCCLDALSGWPQASSWDDVDVIYFCQKDQNGNRDQAIEEA